MNFNINLQYQKLTAYILKCRICEWIVTDFVSLEQRHTLVITNKAIYKLYTFTEVKLCLYVAWNTFTIKYKPYNHFLIKLLLKINIF